MSDTKKQYRPVLNVDDMSLIDTALGELYFSMKETAIERGVSLEKFEQGARVQQIKNLRTDLSNLR